MVRRASKRTSETRNKIDRKLLNLYNLQLSTWNRRPKSWKTILQSLLNRPGKPPLPRAEWERIVRGEPSNFKTVLSEFKSFRGTKSSVNIGDFKITFGGSQALLPLA